MPRKPVSRWLAALLSAALFASPPAVHAQVNTPVWINMTASGASPGGDRDMGLAYDSHLDKLYYYGAHGTWRMDFGPPIAWTDLTASMPASNEGDNRAVYDPVHNRVVRVNSQMRAYQLSLDAPTGWQEIIVPSAPPPRSFFAATYDAARNRLIVFGGGPYTGLYSDVWALSLNDPPQWTQITGTGTPPEPRWAPVAAYDSDHDQLIVGTGSTTSGYAITSDFWTLTLSGTPAWQKLAPSGTVPPKRMASSAVYDPGGHQMLLIGGFDGNAALGDVQALSMVGAPSWGAITTTGSSPTPAWSRGIVYRASQGQVVIFSGWNGSVLLNETWALQIGSPAVPPTVSGFTPKGGQVGDQVTIAGFALAAATNVSFNGVSAPILLAGTTSVSVTVPPGATTGPISVTTPYGTASSTDSFFVGLPAEIDAVVPAAGKVGASVALRGSHLATASKVAFGSASNAPFLVSGDTLITAVVDSAARTGPITVTTLVASLPSAATFTVLPPDTAARLLSVTDVRNDQGGFVSVRWLRSDYDVSPHRWITGYRVWRRAMAEGAAASKTRPQTWRVTKSASGALEFWEPLADLAAAHLPGYAYTAATVQDSIDGANPYTAFFIETLTTDPFTFFASNVDSGYSVDNLAPPAPTPFTASYQPNGVALHWVGSQAPDLSGYRLYRGLTLDFDPGPANLIASQPDTGYFDANGNPGFVYKLAALDLHGNLGRFAIVSAGAPTATLASLVSSRVEGTTVHLRWYLTLDEPTTITVYRSDDEVAWQALRTALPDGAGYVSFEDGGLVPGRRYGYRLGLRPVTGAEFAAGEGWVDIPGGGVGTALSVTNPVTAGDVTVSFAPPGGRDVGIGLFDIAGRLVASRSVHGDGSRTTVSLAHSADLPAGLYLVRVGLEHPMTLRVAVVK